MSTDGQSYLDRLAGSSTDGFKARFAMTAKHLGLANLLCGSELRLLLDATLYATVCKIAFHGHDGWGRQIHPAREANRITLERGFISAREQFFLCEGWLALSPTQQEAIHRSFLDIIVAEDKLDR